VECAASRLQLLNPRVQISTHTEEGLLEDEAFLNGFDLVVMVDQDAKSIVSPHSLTLCQNGASLFLQKGTRRSTKPNSYFSSPVFFFLVSFFPLSPLFSSKISTAQTKLPHSQTQQEVLRIRFNRNSRLRFLRPPLPLLHHVRLSLSLSPSLPPVFLLLLTDLRDKSSGVL